MARRKKKDQAEQGEGRAAPPDEREEPSSLPFIVALGASAGGLDALSRFFSQVPSHVREDSGVAFVVVQHMAADRQSLLPQLLDRASRIPVVAASDGERVEPNHVYVIPPGKGMLFREGRLVLVDRQASAHTVDLLFRSLAEQAGAKVVAVVLSGTGADGTVGARAVKAKLGMVIVQSPETAAFDGMPRSALAAGVEDLVLAPEDMPRHIVEYVRVKTGGPPGAGARAIEHEGGELESIFGLVRAKTNRDYSGYKIGSIRRRIERRMAVTRVDSIADYVALLREDPREVEALARDFLINVTSFFRDPEAFEALGRATRAYLEGRPEEEPVRAWVVGCSTGEEAYSVAFLLQEHVEKLGRRQQVQVFGSDLDAEAIHLARLGRYPLSIADEVGPERLERFFERRDGQLAVRPFLRENLVFAVHDLTTDAPFSRMDLVSVRNLLIYFGADLQRRVMPLLHYALVDGGLLFLGTAETVGQGAERFEVVDRKWRIYAARKTAGDRGFRVPALPRVGRQRQPEPLPTQKRSERLLLSAMPPAVLVDRDDRVVYAHGRTAGFLSLPEGAPSMGLLEMASPELRPALAGALAAARASGAARVEALRVRVDGAERVVDLAVRAVPEAEVGARVVSFEVRPERPPEEDEERETEQRFAELDRELVFTRESLRGLVEELETANEELSSANEEFQSTNEELQSTNEELETSREELQSVNEELVVMNGEHQQKIDELTVANDDMRNLLDSTGVAIVFLDLELRVLRFTPAATSILNLLPVDTGRPLSDITTRLSEGGRDISRIAAGVLEVMTPVERSVQTRAGAWYSMRVIPYLTRDESVAGVVVAFVDIGRVKAAEVLSRVILDAARDAVLVLDDELRVVLASRSFFEKFRESPETTEGRLLYELGDGRWDKPVLRQLLEEVLPRDGAFDGLRIDLEFPLLGPRTMELNARRISAEGEIPYRVLLVMADLTRP